MTDSSPNRREFLAALAGLGVASAGCLSLGGNDSPRYTELVPAVEDGLAYAYVDFDITEETDDGGDLVPILLPSPSDGEEQPVELPDDALAEREEPLLGVSLGVGSRILLAGTLGFSTAGLGSYVQRGASETVDELVVANTEALGTGRFDTDQLDQRLRTESRPVFDPVYEFVGESGGFRFYNVAESGSFNSPRVVAVSKEQIALGRSRDSVERLVGAARGERDRALDAMTGFDQLAEQVGGGNVVAGWHGPLDPASVLGETEPVPDALSTDDDVSVAVDLAPESDELTVDLAVRTDSLSADRRETLETAFDAPGVETTASPDAGQFSATGTYSEIPFKPVGSDWTDDLPSGENLPPAVDEAVPDGAIVISADPDQADVYRVEFVEDVQVDELTVRAVEADWEITMSQPDATEWVSAYPDPEGDEIRVVATVDGVSGIVATKEVP